MFIFDDWPEAPVLRLGLSLEVQETKLQLYFSRPASATNATQSVCVVD